MRSVVVAIIALTAACAGSTPEVGAPATSTAAAPDITLEVEGETITPTVTSTVPVADRLPPLASEVDGAIRSPEGFLLPVRGTDGDVWFVVGACGDERVVPGGGAEHVDAVHVVLDPGGDDDPAAQANLAVALAAESILEADGVVVELTRRGPGELSATTRGFSAPAVGARAFVSIHHSAAEGETTDPRPAVFHRADDPESSRLGGLIHEQMAEGLVGVSGVASPDEPGVRPLLNQRGDDYFRTIGSSTGAAAVRLELGARAEEADGPLGTEGARRAEADALAAAVVRFLVSEEEGSGFIEPVEPVRTAPTTNAPGGCG